MYILFDTFNKKAISRHRTVEAAATAANKHSRAIRRIHGGSSYIPTNLFLDSFDAYGDPKKADPSDVDYFDQCRAFRK